VVVSLLFLAGCSDEETGTASAGDAALHESTFGHVHGLGVNPADDRLYVASHLGVFRETDAGFELVADRRQDTMAFTVAGPDHFLASGHPDPREGGPSHLGLIGSTDAAATWKPLALVGEGDFHTLEIGGDRLYGFNSLTGTLIASEDGQTWVDLLRTPLLDFVVDPEDPDVLVVADERGVLMRLEAGSQPQAISGAPQVGFLDWSPAGDDLAGLGPAGELWLSEDGGTSWSEVGAVPGTPQALSIDADPWYAASDRGLFSSTDEGRTWEPVPLD
jgi:hypothetical protein